MEHLRGDRKRTLVAPAQFCYRVWLKFWKVRNEYKFWWIVNSSGAESRLWSSCRTHHNIHRAVLRKNDEGHKTTRLAKFDGEGVFNAPPPQRDQLLLIGIFPLQSIFVGFFHALACSRNFGVQTCLQVDCHCLTDMGVGQEVNYIEKRFWSPESSPMHEMHGGGAKFMAATWWVNTQDFLHDQSNMVRSMIPISRRYIDRESIIQLDWYQWTYISEHRLKSLPPAACGH
jgi:hypothetical protein